MTFDTFRTPNSISYFVPTNCRVKARDSAAANNLSQGDLPGASRRLLIFLSSIDHGEFVKNRPLACKSPPVKRTASSFLLDPLHHHHPFKQQRVMPSDSMAAFVPFFGSNDVTASSRPLRDNDEEVASRNDDDTAAGDLPNLSGNLPILGGISLSLDGLGRYNATDVCLVVFE
uniref:Uncharacterized protein n=1 Tax=Plectus sambesii TaxID=2011161 RepID=A0A914WB85_9BILA